MLSLQACQGVGLASLLSVLAAFITLEHILDKGLEGDGGVSVAC